AVAVGRGGSDRTGIVAGERVDGAVQRVRQRHVEDVVGHLSGEVTGLRHLVPQFDLKSAQAWLVVITTDIVLAVQRRVVLEHEYRQLRGEQRVRVRGDGQRVAR